MNVLKLERRPIASGNVPSPGPTNLSSRSRVRSDSHGTSVGVFGSSQLLNFNTSEWCAQCIRRTGRESRVVE